MIRSLVVAMARNRVIGRDNALPWKLPADLAYFKRVTMGKPVVMGRRTWESIGKALPGRHNIVVTSNPAYSAPGATVVTSLEDAWKAAGDAPEVAVIGGSRVFEETLPIADRIHLTEVEADVPGDTYFPRFDRSGWSEREVERHAAGERHALPFRIVLLERRR
ncbi:MAG TPA: type 3 dihydrofolate reductase [Usitatibacter sp.]|nr:type 3 dihydrofolate reductase [Usitatibacter sp.]